MFVIIGERINTSRKPVLEATMARDADYIRDDVLKQQAAGAAYIDVNGGARVGCEAEDMRWLLDVIQPVTSVPLSLDSADPLVLEMAYDLVDREPLINSISLERRRLQPMLEFLHGRACSVLGLCMDDGGLPANPAEVVTRATRLVEQLDHIGVVREKIYIDPTVQPIGTGDMNGVLALESIRLIHETLPGVRTACGLSNVSFGLPLRKVVNATFLTMMMTEGLSGAIMDPLDSRMITSVRVTEMLRGQDPFCRGYLKAVRAGGILS